MALPPSPQRLNEPVQQGAYVGFGQAGEIRDLAVVYGGAVLERQQIPVPIRQVPGERGESCQIGSALRIFRGCVFRQQRRDVIDGDVIPACP